ncbi:MAG: rod shape-determining protein MreC [Candidatus Firestonebacteria bacterium]|nr:rod shape-determining protein MreC [Candidatus Firestonebacteria bacterium]
MIKGNISKTNKKYLIFILYLFISIVLMVTQINRPRRTSLIKELGLLILVPIQKTTMSVSKGINEVYRNIMELGTLRNENRKMIELLNNYKQQESIYQEVIIENQRLRKILNFKKHHSYNLISAEVIGKDPTNWFKTIIINRGTKYGIKKNMAVITPDGLVGKIVEGTKWTARVQLILDMNSSLGVIIQRTRTVGILRGLSQKICQLDYISRTKDVKIGDMVITSGLGGIFPKGIPIGKVSKIEKDNYGLFQKVEINPNVNFYNIEEVLILEKPIESINEENEINEYNDKSENSNRILQ